MHLVVQFANGQQVTHDDVGVWLFQATRGSDLDGTVPEHNETFLKAAITDGIKACSEYLGTCFRPLGDETLDRHIRRGKITPVTLQQENQVKPADSLATQAKSSSGTSPGPTDFWSRFNEIEVAGRISADLRNSPEINQARQTGEWTKLLRWLDSQTS